MEPLTAQPLSGHLAFTCIVPVYAADNAEHFVEAMQSIARSTLRPAAVLIAQDGDLPTSLAAEVLACVSAGARVIRNRGPRGLHHNLNNTLPAVRTPWVARADADDINLPERFMLQTRCLEENPAITVLGGAIVEFWPDGRQREKPMPLTHDAIVARARWRNPINHMTAVFRLRAVVDAGGYPDLSQKEDYGLWLTMIARGELFSNLAAPVVRARLGADFHQRRSGMRNLASELGIYRIKRRVPRIGAARAGLAMAARAAILAGSGPARLIYEGLLRR